MLDPTSRIGRIGAAGLVLVLAAIFIYPLVVAVLTSLGGEGLSNYFAVLENPALPRFAVNSVIVSASCVALVYGISMLAGFGLAKLRLRGSSVLMGAILLGLMVPSIALIVPLFLIVRGLGLFDTYIAVIVPLVALLVPFATLLVRNYLESIPDELLDAARIDGASSLTALRLVILPLARPIGVVVAVWSLLISWNEYFMPLVFMQSDDMRLLTQAPQFFVGVYATDLGKVFAALVLISLPIVATYLLLQRHFEAGLTAGAVK